jgi:hypothetical protein
MIPSNKWFPTNLQERAAWFDNYSFKMQTLGAALGFSPAELSSIKNDNEWVQFLATAAVTADTYDEAMRSFRRTLTEGNIGDPDPSWPADITFTLPDPVETGIWERLDDAVKRIRVAPAYTPEIGADLGIITSSSGGGSLGPGSKPTFKANSMPGSEIEIRFTRGASDGLKLDVNIDNDGFDKVTHIALRSPYMLEIPPNETAPRQVQIRARFLDGNSAIGDWSDIVVVQTIP